MSDFLMLPGVTASWAVPVESITHIGEFQVNDEARICDTVELLGLDATALPRRVVRLVNRSGEFGLLAFGHTFVFSPDPLDVLELPPLLRRDPAGNLARSVIARDGIASAWVLDVDHFRDAEGTR